MKLKLLRLSISLSLLCASSLVSLAQAAQPLNRIVVVVNEKIITQSELEQQIHTAKQQLIANHIPLPSLKTLQQQALDTLIDTELQLQVAKNHGLKISDAMVDQAISDIAQSNGLTLAQLRSYLSKQGIDYKAYRQTIRKQMLIGQLQQQAVGSDIKVTDQEVASMVARLKSKITTAQAPASYHVEDILIPVEESATAAEIQEKQRQAQSLLDKIRDTANFKELVETYNLQGGDLGWRTLAQLPELFINQVTKMQAGEVAGPIRAPNGFHLIRLLAVQNNTLDQQRQVTETHVRHIMLKSNSLTTDADLKLRLNHLRNELEHDADFTKLAATYSQDPNTATQGGDLGWLKPDMVEPSFEAAIRGLNINQISQPFQTHYGWHIAQVLGRRQVDNTQNLLREQARKEIYNRKFNEAVKRWLHQLRGDAYVKIVDAD